MSNLTFNSEYIYNLPAAAVHEFTRVMDSLPDFDWQRFASRVICDQTELRLVEQSGRRTETLMHKWGCRNGTVGDLVAILQELELLRPLDMIRKWRRVSQPSPVLTSSNSLPPQNLSRSSSPSSSLFTPVKDATRSLPIIESKLQSKPGPPLPDLNRTCPCTLSTVSCKEKKEECPCDSCAAQTPPFTAAMCWPFEEVQRGTDNFSAARQIGEGGFGHVYRASMRNTEFAVKRLKENGSALSWSQRVKVVVGSAQAIQYLHSCSPALIHGDVKSSNILLGEHLEPKLGDFGLARLCRCPSRTPGRTSSVAQTSTVRGTLAYLPDEYLKDGQLGMEIDVYSFGVVLLEVLTGRRALETGSKSKNVYLKDLVSDPEDDGRSYSRKKDTRELSGSQAAENIWKNHLDRSLTSEGTSGPRGAKEIAQLACRCLDRRRKKRPPMTEVFKSLQEVHTSLEARHSTVTSRTSPPFPPPPLLSGPKPLRSDNSVDSLAHQFSNLGPQENTFCCSHHHSCPSPYSPATCSEESGRREGSWDSRCSSVRTPCESDDRVVINPVRQHLVEKMALYEEGRILTSDLFSSAGPPNGSMNAHPREPEESDEFASSVA